MNRSLQQMASMALALFALAAPLRAQALTPVYDFALPAGHGYIVGLDTNGADLFLFTVDTYYTSPFDVGGSMGFTKGPVDFIDLGVRLNPNSLTVFNPTNTNEAFFTGGLGANVLLYSYTFWSPAQTSVRIGDFFTPPTGLAAAEDGAIFVSSSFTGEGIFKLPNADDGTPVLNFGTSGPGALNTPKALSFGPDGLLYVLDTGDERIVSFDSAGEFQSAFSLVSTPAASGMAISPDGRIFVTKSEAIFEDDVWQVADIYDSYTGILLGHLTTPTDDIGIGLGKPSIAIEGDYLYWTSGTGASVYVFAVPEPSLTACLLGAGTLAMAFLRRRKRPQEICRTSQST